MSRPKAVTLAVFTAVPFVIWMGMWCGLQEMSAEGRAAGFRWIINAGFVSVIGVWGLVGFYICHMLRNKHVDKKESVLWCLMFFLTHLLAMSVYWCLYIWNHEPAVDRPSESASTAL